MVKEDATEYTDQSLVSLQKYPQEVISFISARKYTYLSKDLISEYIMEIETKYCTSLACKCKEFFLRHDLEEVPLEIPMWKLAFTSKDVVYNITCIL